ncbi:MAG: methylated-DNA--[protein]-cysteine S-methyltransferase [Pseudomonadota bacterium]
MAESFRYTYLNTPIGALLLAADDLGLARVSFPTGDRTVRPGADWAEDAAPLTEALAQLRAYFAGELTAFDLALSPGGTTFQRSVWLTLPDIGFGETASYSDIARRIGRPRATRAVGAANGANPLPIVLPCHRIVGADGSLTGFGGGLPIKRFLLAHEGRSPAQADLFQPSA